MTKEEAEKRANDAIQNAKGSGWHSLPSEEVDELLDAVRGRGLIDTSLILFIYQKGDKTRCLTLDKAKAEQEQLLSDGWEHTETLNAQVAIEYERNNEGRQERYEAAREFMAKFPNGSAPLVGGYVDQALRIAAGLPTD